MFNIVTLCMRTLIQMTFGPCPRVETNRCADIDHCTCVLWRQNSRVTLWRGYFSNGLNQNQSVCLRAGMIVRVSDVLVHCEFHL